MQMAILAGRYIIKWHVRPDAGQSSARTCEAYANVTSVVCMDGGTNWWNKALRLKYLGAVGIHAAVNMSPNVLILVKIAMEGFCFQHVPLQLV